MAAQLAASQEGLSSVLNFNIFFNIILYHAVSIEDPVIL
jgi:hypothetical protein